MSDIQIKLIQLQIGSCTCDTKTPEIQYHDDNCKFKILSEIGSEIKRLQQELDRINRMTASRAVRIKINRTHT